MKNTSLILSIISLVAVIALGIISFTGQGRGSMAAGSGANPNLCGSPEGRNPAPRNSTPQNHIAVLRLGTGPYGGNHINYSETQFLRHKKDSEA